MKINHQETALYMNEVKQSAAIDISKKDTLASLSTSQASLTTADTFKLNTNKYQQGKQEQKAQASQKLMQVQKKLQALAQQIKLVSEAHGKVLINQLKLLSNELKQAVSQYKQGSSDAGALVNLGFYQPRQQTFRGEIQNVSRPPSVVSRADAGNSEFQTLLSKVKSAMKVLIRMAKSTMTGEEERQSADILRSKVDKIRLEQGTATELQLNLLYRFQQAVGLSMTFSNDNEAS